MLNKLIKIAIYSVIAFVMLYFFAYIIAGIVMLVYCLIKWIISIYKGAQRYTDWSFKYSRQVREPNTGEYFRVQYFERFDRRENKLEERQVKIPIPIDPKLGEENSLNLEWIFNGVKETKARRERVRKELGYNV